MSPVAEKFESFANEERAKAKSANDVPNRWDALVTPILAHHFATPPPPREWLLHNVLPLGIAGMLVAAGGVGKTMTAIGLAISVSTGEPWLGTFQIGTQGNVFLILGEEDAEEVHRRIYHSVRSRNATHPDPGTIVTLPLAGHPCSFIENEQHGNLKATAFFEWLLKCIETNGPFALIVVDPLSRFAGLDAETDSAAATRFIQALEQLAATVGATILVLHHSTKASRGNGIAVDSTAARGSTALVDGPRWAATLAEERIQTASPEAQARLGEIVTLTVTKSNYAAKPEPVLLRRDNEHGGALLPLDSIDLEIVERARAGANPTSKRKEARNAEREEKTAKEAEKRAQDEEEKRSKDAARRITEDKALVAILRARPGISHKDLRLAMSVALGGCSNTATDLAIERLGAAIERASGPKGSRLHSLVEDLLPPHLQEPS